MFLYWHRRYDMYFFSADLSFAVVFPKSPIFVKKTSYEGIFRHGIIGFEFCSGHAQTWGNSTGLEPHFCKVAVTGKGRRQSVCRGAGCSKRSYRNSPCPKRRCICWWSTESCWARPYTRRHYNRSYHHIKRRRYKKNWSMEGKRIYLSACACVYGAC